MTTSLPWRFLISANTTHTHRVYVYILVGSTQPVAHSIQEINIVDPLGVRSGFEAKSDSPQVRSEEVGTRGDGCGDETLDSRLTERPGEGEEELEDGRVVGPADREIGW